jgi:CubicO group peptidase (beta-lactamase class C family)
MYPSMKSRPLFACLVLSVTTAGVLRLAAAEAPPDAALDARIARVEHGLLPPARLTGSKTIPWTLAGRMAFYRVPGLSLTVIDHGAIAWTRGYGVARAGGAEPVGPDTLFQAASISKVVSAAAALALVDAGKLDLDGDVNARLRSWKIPAAEVAAGEPVTLRRLLSHTAGITVDGFDGYAAGAPVPTLLQVLDGTPPANSAPIRIDRPPGSLWRYSGGGYTIVQQLLLDVTGADFPALVRERVFVPAGMTASTLEQPLPPALASRAAAGHLKEGQPVAGGAQVYPELAAAGLWTTSADLARFALALHHSLESPGGLLTPATARQMVTPPLADSHYGLGIGVDGADDRLQLSHGGANEGFRSMLVTYPRLGRGAVILTNSENGALLAEEILRSLSAEYDWPDYRVVEKTAVPFPPVEFDAFVGRYQHEDTLAAIFRDGPHFYFQIRGQVRREIFPSSDHEFFLLNSPEKLSFGRNAAGQPAYFFRTTEPPQIFQRVR